MYKVIAIIVAIIALISLVTGIGLEIHSSGYDSGRADEKVEQADSRASAKKAENKAVNELIEERKKVKVITREKIKYVKTSVDPTGCIDTPFAAMGLRNDGN